MTAKKSKLEHEGLTPHHNHQYEKGEYKTLLTVSEDLEETSHLVSDASPLLVSLRKQLLKAVLFVPMKKVFHETTDGIALFRCRKYYGTQTSHCEEEHQVAQKQPFRLKK